MSSRNNISEIDLEAILLFIKDTYGYDFSQYSKASISRRILRFASEIDCYTTADIIHRLNESEFFVSFLEKITVNVTEMFRDPEFYRAFNEVVIPRLASYPIIKVWVAGCSTGEEVFSIAILLHEAGLLTRSRLYATDINPVNLDKAKKGIVSLNSMKDYTTNYIKAGGKQEFASYYIAKYNNAIINKELRDRITFSEHNLVTDSVFNEFQLVCCRNVIIYFNKELQNRVINLFHRSLAPLGYLALGIKESLLFTDVRTRFDVVSSSAKIFRRIN